MKVCLAPWQTVRVAVLVLVPGGISAGCLAPNQRVSSWTCRKKAFLPSSEPPMFSAAQAKGKSAAVDLSSLSF